VPPPTDGVEKLLTFEIVLAVCGPFLPSEVKTKKSLIEYHPNKLDLEDLKEEVCGTSCCQEDATLYRDLEEEEWLL
jgi:hypothetical protein